MATYIYWSLDLWLNDPSLDQSNAHPEQYQRSSASRDAQDPLAWSRLDEVFPSFLLF